MVQFNGAEIELVKKAYGHLGEQYHDNPGLYIFLSLFKLSPKYLENFNNHLTVPAPPADGPRPAIEAFVDSIVDNQTLRKHCSNVWHAMKMLFDNLADEKKVDETLSKLVQAHKKRSIKVEDFDDLPAAFKALLAKQAPFGTKALLNDQEREVLIKAFEHLVHRMEHVYEK